MNQLPTEDNQFIEGDKNSSAKGDNSQFLQGNNNHVGKSVEKIDVTINVIKHQSKRQKTELHRENCSDNSNKTIDLALEKNEIEIHFFISGTLKNKKSKVTLKEFEKHLQKIANDVLLTIDDVEEGSLKFILKGTHQGLDRLENLFKTGELTEIFGVPVENVSFLESDKHKLALTIAVDISKTDIKKLEAAITKKHMNSELELLCELEELLRYETNPRIKHRYIMQINRLKKTIDNYQQKYYELQRGVDQEKVN